MYKSKLQELCHQRGWRLGEYRTVKDGPDHNPRFTSAVTVNGVPFHTPPNECRSSKEAQDRAANLAFNHFSSSNHVEAPPHADINHQQIALLFNQQTPSAFQPHSGPKEILHTFKNRLQHFTQKHNLPMPAYFNEFEGPPHARHFRSKVIIGDKTHESSEFFPTLKEAEHAAAKVAFEALSHDDIQEDETLYKTLLQELAQKKGLHFPKYNTVKSGPSHVPTFISALEIGTDVFQGLEAKTKKQAEMSAAKVAYNALLQCQQEQGPSSYHIKETSGVTPLNLQSSINKGLLQDIAPSPSSMGEAAANKECILKEALTISTSSPHFVADWQHGIQPTVEKTSVRERNVDQDARCEGQLTLNSDLNAELQDPSPRTSSPEPYSSAIVNHPKRVISDTKHHKAAGACHKISRKFIVYPKDVKRETPDAASIMPYSDDHYVAFELKDNTVQ